MLSARIPSAAAHLLRFGRTRRRLCTESRVGHDSGLPLHVAHTAKPFERATKRFVAAHFGLEAELTLRFGALQELAGRKRHGLRCVEELSCDRSVHVRAPLAL